MIQRIQTIFLALASLANFSLFGVPFATTPEAAASSEIFADQQYNLQDNIALLLFFTLSGLLALAAIFLYNNRKLQMRMTIFSIIALVVAGALCLIFFLNNSKGLGDVEVNDGFGVYLPVLSLIFGLLAYRSINKDEKLVQSMDRLR